MNDQSWEARRLAALRRYEVLDTDADESVDDLAFLASRICGTPISLVSLVDAERQWFKARVGLEARETPREWAFCAHAIQQEQLFVVEDALADPRFADNPLVAGDPKIRFYAGAPLIAPTGETLGTLCVIDRVPRHLDDEQKEALRRLARQVVQLFELRLSARRLEASRRLLHLVLESAAHAIYELDREGKLVYANAACLSALGYDSLVEIEGRPMHALVHHLRSDGSSRGAEECPLLRGLVDGTPVRVDDDFLVRKDGSSFDAITFASPIIDDGEVRGLVVTFTDVSVRKRLEDALRAEVELRGRMAAMVAHDLRNPLTSLRMSLQLMAGDAALSERERRLVDRGQHSVDRMGRIVSDLLDLARTQGSLRVEPHPTELCEVVRQVVAELSAAHPDRQIALRLPRQLHGTWDADRIAQLLSNLVGNAVQHGSPELPISVTVDETAEGAQVEVSNRGAPIEAARLPGIFDPFSRGSESKARNPHGLGLGLYISREIAVAHGGELSVRSTDGEGTTFTLRLPRVSG